MIGPLNFLSILHKAHSNAPFYWNMNIVNTKSIPNYTKCIPGYTRYLHSKSKRDALDKVGTPTVLYQTQSNCKSEHYLHSNSTEIISHYCWNTHSARLLQSQINTQNWGQPKAEDWNVSSVNTVQVSKRKIIGMCVVQYAQELY